MKSKIIKEPLDVDAELHSMGLTRDGLVVAVRYAESERTLCTGNDPIGFPSYVVYARAARKLREIFVPRGWEKDDTYNQAAIKNIKAMIRVVPCNFDEGAGNEDATPANKSPKGETSRKKSLCNRTRWLPFPEPFDSAQLDDDGFKTWLLGIHIDDQSPTTAELSLPIEFDGKYFTRFGPRIILLDGTEPEPTPARKGESDDAFEVIDIAISRK
jgi:hypothetical protein